MSENTKPPMMSPMMLFIKLLMMALTLVVGAAIFWGWAMRDAAPVRSEPVEVVVVVQDVVEMPAVVMEVSELPEPVVVPELLDPEPVVVAVAPVAVPMETVAPESMAAVTTTTPVTPTPVTVFVAMQEPVPVEPEAPEKSPSAPIDPFAAVVTEPMAAPMESVAEVAGAPMTPIVPLDPFAADGVPAVVERTFEGFVERPFLWPKTLNLTVETSVPIIYRGRNYGSLSFVPGQTIEVKSILNSREVVGSVDGNHLVISVEKTNLLSWFKETYTGRYELIESSADITAAPDEGEIYHVDLVEGLRKWCYINYGDCTLRITDDGLMLRWRPEVDGPIDYRTEARAIARKYLEEQAARGATDNYAPCEIYHLSTGRLLGIGAFFAPSFVDLAHAD